jgi:hypothetical protein
MIRQVNIKVVRLDKKRPTWGVKFSHCHEYGLMWHKSMLPGEFRYRDARAIANVLAVFYRANGYKVALDTKTCQRRPTAATQAYGVA